MNGIFIVELSLQNVLHKKEYDIWTSDIAVMYYEL